jgi:hypothetical protein
MAEGVHEGIYSSIVCWFRRQHLFTKNNSLFKFLGPSKSESLQRLTICENLVPESLEEAQVP